MRRRRRAGEKGYSLIEVMIVAGLVTGLVALAVPNLRSYLQNQRVKGAARTLADAFAIARAEAIRSGNNHAVFLGPPGTTDPAGNPLLDGTGAGVPILVLNDGAPVASDCTIGVAERRTTFPPEDGVQWGVTSANVVAPGDPNPGPPANGVNFRDQNGNAVRWLMFRPDGIPVTFTNACALGPVGTAAGAAYVTNGARDYAVTLTALGAVRVYGWLEGEGWQ